MQWLIDLVIEAIGIPPVYIDRETYTDSDFDETTLTLDNAWHDLDLSSIIDEDTSAVVILIQANASVVGNTIQLRKKGTTSSLYTVAIRTQVANLRINQNPVIGVDSDGILEYKITASNWNAIDMVVRGWWL